MQDESTKRCRKCGEEKPRSAFHKSARSSDGVQARCRSCRKMDNHESYVRHRETRAETSRAWVLANRERVAGIKRKWREANRDSERAGSARWASENPERIAAHRALHAALRAGEITKPSVCQACGHGGWIVAHHYDYSRPLKVIWLCRSCHSGHHNGWDNVQVVRPEVTPLRGLHERLRSERRASTPT
jgi:hypothetical protein